jgi:hypothetical protein
VSKDGIAIPSTPASLPASLFNALSVPLLISPLGGIFFIMVLQKILPRFSKQYFSVLEIILFSMNFF